MKYIVANWKSNKNREETVQWMDEFAAHALAIDEQQKVILCPPFPELMFVANRLLDKTKFSRVELGVQDLSSYPTGSYTGAVSARNVSGFDVRYAIVGHSERRRYFHETHQDVANKVSQCLENGITPIVCVDQDYVQAQANAIAIAPEYLSRCLVAYEPLEAIGSGFNQPVAEITPVIADIKHAFGQVPVIYGGSAAPSNVAEYMTVTDGVLVGHHSLVVADFAELIKNAR